MSRPAMILAAGFGTRMGALTADRPKPLLQVAGRTLIDHAIEAARAANAAPIVVNGHYHADQLGRHLAERHPDIRFVVEEPEILDSGGGIKNALPILGGGAIATLNADAVWRGPGPIDVLHRAWRPGEMGALMLLVPRDRAVGRLGGGDADLAPDGGIRWNTAPGALVYTGAQIIETSPIAHHPGRVFPLREIWDRLRADGRLFGCVYPGLWADVGHPDGLGQATEMLRHDADL